MIMMMDTGDAQDPSFRYNDTFTPVRPRKRRNKDKGPIPPISVLLQQAGEELEAGDWMTQCIGSYILCLFKVEEERERGRGGFLMGWSQLSYSVTQESCGSP
jgi:hypothetical protein